MRMPSTANASRAQSVPYLPSDLPEANRRKLRAFDSEYNVIKPEGPRPDKVEYLRPRNAREERRALLVADLADSEQIPVDRYVEYHDRMVQAIGEVARRTGIRPRAQQHWREKLFCVLDGVVD